MTSTAKNFAISGLFIVALIGLVFWKESQPTGCENSNHTVLILLDTTDPLSERALSATKEYVWGLIDAAPAFSRVIFKEIRGVSRTTGEQESTVLEACRKNNPEDLSAGFRGPTKPVEAEWRELKDWVCGQSPSGDPVACNSPQRSKNGIFDRSSTASESSPILESIVDGAREYLTTRDQSWTLAVITDWRQYGSALDLHTKKCDLRTPIDYSKVPFLADASRRAFSVRGNPDSQSRIVSYFVLRESMTNDEANCLQSFAERFLGSQLESSSTIEPFEIIRLPKSPS
jgi:hypothetical protein